MGIADTYALGRNIQSTAVAQTAINTAGTHAAAGSFSCLGYKVSQAQERRPRKNARQTRSTRERIHGAFTNSLSVMTEILPRGGATPPDVGALLASAIGTETIGGASVTYGLSATQALTAYDMLFEENAVFSERCIGFVVNELKLSITQGEEPKFEFSGPCVRVVETADATANGSVDGSGVAVTSVTPNPSTDNAKFGVDSLITVGTSTGHTVTAVDRSTGALTISPSITTNEGTAPAITPYTPFDEAQTAGSVVSEVEVSVDIGADSGVLFTGAELSINNNISEVRQAGNGYVQDFNPGFREITGKISMYGRSSDLAKYVRRKFDSLTSVNPLAVSITLGPAATGSFQCTISMPRCEFDFSELDTSQEQEATFELPFVALASTVTASDDEFSMVFDTV